MRRRTAKILSVISTIVAALLCLLVIPTGNNRGLMIVAIIYLPLVIWLKYCQRCKNCGRWPGKYDSWEKYCPRCGKKLE